MIATQPPVKPWRFSAGEQHSAREFSLMMTTPQNALRAAAYVRTHGLRKGARAIFGRGEAGLFLEDALGGGLTAARLASALSRAALRAQAHGGKVAFRTETGGYPWRYLPEVWKP